MKKKKFARPVFDPEHEVFILYVATLNISSDLGDKVYPFKKTQMI